MSVTGQRRGQRAGGRARRLIAIAGCAVLLATGATAMDLAGTEQPAAAAEADLLECAPTSPYVYNLRSPDGLVGGQRVNRVERVDVNTGEVVTIADFTAGIAAAENVIAEQVNALGIRRDEQGRGRWLVFATSNIGNSADSGQPPRPQDVRNVYQYDLLTEELTATRIPDSIWAADSNHITRHGAIDLSTGTYYFATHRNNSDEFTLIAYDLDTHDVWLAGHLLTPGASGSSGDMAFDSLGRLYFVVGGQNAAQQFTAPSGVLPTTPGEQVDLTLTASSGAATDTAASQQSPPLSPTNGVGVAFGPYGYLYETFGSGFGYRVDPSTGQVVPDDVVRPQDDALVDLSPAQPGSTARGGSSTDLATCASPSTLEVRKFVNHREDDTDQFTLSVTRADGVDVGQPVTTTGTDNGVQAAEFGPVGILTLREDGTTPWTYTISETGAGTTDLADYETRYRCVDRNDASWGPYEGVLDGSGERSFEIETPSRDTPGSRAIVCTFTNAVPGNPIIQKGFDDDTPQAAVDEIDLTGTYRCEYDGTDPVTVNEGTWTVQGTAPALLLPAPGSTTDVPVGSVCQVWEDGLDDAVFPDSSWGWLDPVFSPQTPGDPTSATVTITGDDTLLNTVTITNAARQATGPLQIVKDFAGDVPDWVDGVTFDGIYSCVYAGLDGVAGTDDDVVNAGTWQIIGTGSAALDPAADAIPLTSTCTVTENTPAAADLPDDAWQWLTPSFTPAGPAGDSAVLSIDSTEANTATVTNAASAFRIVKSLPEDVPDWLDEITYTGTYSCDADEATLTGTWEVIGAGQAARIPTQGQTAAIPLDAVCTATEDDLNDDDLPDASWAWDEPVLSPNAVTIGSDLEANTITVANSVDRVFTGVDITKTFVSASIDADTGMGHAVYQVIVTNPIDAAGVYGPLTDVPQFSPGLTPTGASWTAVASEGTAPLEGTAAGSGPYALATEGTAIAGGATHTFTLTVDYVYAEGGTPITGACTGAADGLFNTVAVPDGQQDGQTDDDSACGPLQALQLLKIGQDGAGISGSEWRITADADGAPGEAGIPVVTPVDGQTGLFDLTGLPAGTYWLTETRAPAGHQLLAQPIRFDIDADGTVALSEEASGFVTLTEVDGTWRLTASNVPALVLPFTGGTGQSQLAAAGAGLLGLATLIAVAVLARRRPEGRIHD